MVPREYPVYERSGMDDPYTVKRSEEDVSMAITSQGEEVQAEQWRRQRQYCSNQPVPGGVETQGRVR